MPNPIGMSSATTSAHAGPSLSGLLNDSSTTEGRITVSSTSTSGWGCSWGLGMGGAMKQRVAPFGNQRLRIARFTMYCVSLDFDCFCQRAQV